MIGATTKVGGYVTQDKYLRGRSMAEIERYLGFHYGRLARGATFVKLDKLPREDQFETAGYSMVAAHRHRTPDGLDMSRIKAIAMSRWTLTGPDRLVKVIPGIAHDAAMDPDDQYPPGSGVPQWRLRDLIDGTVVAEVNTASDKYQPAL